MQVTKKGFVSLLLTVLAAMLLWTSCTSSSLEPAEYMQWVKNPDNGLLKSVTMGAYHIEAQYQPSALILLQRYKNNLPEKQKALEEMAKLDSNCFFSLTIYKANGSVLQAENDAEFSKKHSYFNFSFQQDLFLETANKKQPCMLYYFEQLQDQLGPNARFELGFDVPGSPGQDKTLLIDSDVLQTGRIRFLFSKKDLQNIPKLRLG